MRSSHDEKKERGRHSMICASPAMCIRLSPYAKQGIFYQFIATMQWLCPLSYRFTQHVIVIWEGILRQPLLTL